MSGQLPLQVAWKFLKERKLTLWIFKNLMWPQALCLAHISLSFIPYCQIGYCSSFDGQMLVNIWLSEGKIFWVCNQIGFCGLYLSCVRNSMTALFLFHHASNKHLVKTYFMPGIVWGTGDLKIKEGSHSIYTAWFHWWYLLTLYMDIFATFCMQLV